MGMDIRQKTPLQYVLEAPTTGLIDEVDSTGNTIYLGFPLNNDATVKTSEAKWRIIKISKSGYVTTKAFANASEGFDQIWDDRANGAKITYTTFA